CEQSHEDQPSPAQPLIGGKQIGNQSLRSQRNAQRNQGSARPERKISPKPALASRLGCHFAVFQHFGTVEEWVRRLPGLGAVKGARRACCHLVVVAGLSGNSARVSHAILSPMRKSNAR